MYSAPYSFMLLFFFFDGSGDHRDLHSFPTRRSSDLFEEHGVVNGARDAVEELLAFYADLARAFRSGGAREMLIRLRMRSEEHTSELQSRQYLVCRLLLEKKKHAQVRTSSRSCACVLT